MKQEAIDICGTLIVVCIGAAIIAITVKFILWLF